MTMRVLIKARKVPVFNPKEAERVSRNLQKALKKVYAWLLSEIIRGQGKLSNPTWKSFEEKLKKALAPFMVDTVRRGFERAQNRFAKPNKGKAEIDKYIGVEIGGSHNLDFVHEHDLQDVQQHLKDVARRSTKNKRAEIERILQDAIKKWENPIEINKHLQDVFPKYAEFETIRIARTETIWSYNEGANKCYKELGVDEVEWDSTLDAATCASCKSMDGKRIKIDQPFVKQGETLAETGLKIKQDVKHPPLHPNCRCSLQPVV